MNEVLEQLEKVVEVMESKLSDKADTDMVELASLSVGSKFKNDLGNFIVLGQLDGMTKVVTEDLYLKGKKFGDSTDYKVSYVRALCENKVLKAFEAVFGAENIIEHEADLTTLDGQKAFGSLKCKVRPISFDEVRESNEILVNEDLKECYWTITAYSTKDRGWGYSLAVVSPSGCIYGNYYFSDCGVRPVCILKSNIFVSKEK